MAFLHMEGVAIDCDSQDYHNVISLDTQHVRYSMVLLIC